MFLKNARSLLKIDGIRTLLRGWLPIWPNAVGFAKHEVLKAIGVPVESNPKLPCIGSQVINIRALIPPPVQSLIGVQTFVPVWALVEVCVEPSGQGELIEIVAAVLE